MELFGLNLTAGRETYIAGDVVSGEMIIQTGKDEIIEDLTVSICGIAHVEWKKCFTKHQETESYFNVKKTLTDLTSARKERKLTGGKPWVKYFELDIPEGTYPINFNSAHGFIHYDVIMTLRLKGREEHATSRPFRMIDTTSSATQFEDCQRPCSQLYPLRLTSLPWMRTRLPVYILPNEGDNTVVKLLFESLPDYCSNDIDLIQRIDYRVDQVPVFTKYSTITCSGVRDQCYDDVVWTELIIPKKKLPILRHCRLLYIRYYIKTSPIKSDLSWLPLSWQRGPEIIFTNHLCRNKEET